MAETQQPADLTGAQETFETALTEADPNDTVLSTSFLYANGSTLGLIVGPGWSSLSRQGQKEIVKVQRDKWIEACGGCSPFLIFSDTQGNDLVTISSGEPLFKLVDPICFLVYHSIEC